jgi:protein-S-isoprenylcysteine O-methyltransferase Ste14
VAALGEGLRTWAAGHLEKSLEVTSSGPYRFTRHPLYLGSTLIGAGMAVASANVWVALLAAAYLGTTITAAMRAEEAHLREKFGDAYDAYAERRAAPLARDWSWARAVHNREHHTMAGVGVALGLLALKAALGN